MATYDFPRNYREAEARMTRQEQSAEDITPMAGKSASPFELQRVPFQGIAIYHDGSPFIAFYEDGRIKIITHGRNSDQTLNTRINAALPKRYRVISAKSRYHEVSNVYMRIVDRTRRGHTIARFINSATFTPEETRTEAECNS